MAFFMLEESLPIEISGASLSLRSVRAGIGCNAKENLSFYSEACEAEEISYLFGLRRLSFVL